MPWHAFKDIKNTSDDKISFVVPPLFFLTIDTFRLVGNLTSTENIILMKKFQIF